MKIETAVDGVAGFSVAGVHAGMKKDGALDFALICSDSDCVTAGVFTRNKVKAAPVLLNMERLANRADHIRAVAINTVCANACTGALGMQNARDTADMVAEANGISSDQALIMSTGVIGSHLQMDKIAAGVRRSSASLGDDWRRRLKRS